MLIASMFLNVKLLVIWNVVYCTGFATSHGQYIPISRSEVIVTLLCRGRPSLNVVLLDHPAATAVSLATRCRYLVECGRTGIRRERSLTKPQNKPHEARTTDISAQPCERHTVRPTMRLEPRSVPNTAGLAFVPNFAGRSQIVALRKSF